MFGAIAVGVGLALVSRREGLSMLAAGWFFVFWGTGELIYKGGLD